VLDIIGKRASAKEWLHYINSSTAIKLYNNGDTRIGRQLRESGYVNDRRPDRPIITDQSKKLIGQHQLKCWLQCMNAIDFPWIGQDSHHTI